MPPKKKGKAKKGNGNNEGDEERAESKPTEREILLSQQWVYRSYRTASSACEYQRFGRSLLLYIFTF